MGCGGSSLRDVSEPVRRQKSLPVVTVEGTNNAGNCTKPRAVYRYFYTCTKHNCSDVCSRLFQYNACKDNMAWCIVCSKRSPSFFKYMGFPPPPTSQSYGYIWKQNTRFLELYIARYLYACTKHNCTDVQQAVPVYICNDNLYACTKHNCTDVQ